MNEKVLIPLEQYEHLIKQEKNTEKSPEQINKLSKDFILMPFGKKHYKNAEALLNFIEKNIDWNDKGEIIIEGELIPFSHISDLLRDSLFNFKSFEPVGYEKFYANLGNIPLSLIKNAKRRSLIGRGKQKEPEEIIEHSDPPPPGIAIDKVPRELNFTLEDWKSQWQTL